MLSATSTRDFGGARYAPRSSSSAGSAPTWSSAIGCSSTARTRRPAKKPNPFVHLYAQLRGTFELAGAAAVHRPRSATCSRRPSSIACMPGRATFRSFGDAVRDRRDRACRPRICAAPVGLEHGPLELPAAVWDAYARPRGRTAARPALHELIARLGEAGVLSHDLTRERRRERARAVRAAVDGDEAALRGPRDVGVAQADRDDRAAVAAPARPRPRRSVAHVRPVRRRLPRCDARAAAARRRACSCRRRDGTPSDVARTVGYGSLDAMGRAFRDANLPSPSVVQEAVRFTRAI